MDEAYIPHPYTLLRQERLEESKNSIHAVGIRPFQRKHHTAKAKANAHGRVEARQLAARLLFDDCEAPVTLSQLKQAARIHQPPAFRTALGFPMPLSNGCTVNLGTTSKVSLNKFGSLK